MKNLLYSILLLVTTSALYSQGAQTNFLDILRTNTLTISNENIIDENEPAILQDIRNMQDQTVATNSSMFIRAVFGFIVTLVGIYFIFIYFKKKSRKVLGSDSIINVLATTPIAPNRYISIVEIVNDLYLIAIADHNITLLSKIEDTETKDQIRMSYSLSKNNIVEDNFKNIFDKVLEKFKQPKTENKDPLDSSKEIKERLENLRK